MTRDKDNKRGNNDLPPGGYDAKVEARFDKVARAKQQQGADPNRAPGNVGNSHADDGGEHRF